MSTASLALTDCATMVRRDLRRMVRYPSLTFQLLVMPVVFLVLFVYVLGGTLGAGLGGGRAEYVEYVTPAILLMAITAAVQGTSISVAMDMTGGIVDRLRTMAIARGSILTGHVVGSLVQTLLSLAAVLGVAVLIGFRPSAGPGHWLALVGLLVLMSLAFIWLAVALGLASRTVESASNVGLPLVLLPFLGSGFVPTDSMPAGLRWFAEHQPFTPLIETVRGLLAGTPSGATAAAAVGWCLLITLGGFLWSTRLFARDSTR
ncbi:ABC transporter permease [Pseudonocardia sp. KRD-184]|uniref:Transport permease protein n=1 Tax=Pseudonocardia oceani TaxID=2792013 RepID=A0ABS6UD33_9PSEU|nr:ABC transporter permease [Pseudonocardia oceani]MBW0089676.1 ABC transporter permease [Pseudonocardia oceani]MBW0095144.1 ABC transporter permease [Pseudonocardia oceani]MBW0107550.1 ABC transporter permease [Pseudonocardia oceani]MBW0120615.1 ABC transporter permease [Pseudonocardia oceani]MBW0129868.1 ABC transporter permease [Pseudonocardia oceani]